MHHKVAIIGAGPSGLLLARLLQNRGIDCIILENRNEPYLRQLNRGGILEHEVVQLLLKEKASNQILEKGILLSQLDFNIQGEKIQLPLDFEKNRKPFIYNQQKIVADLLDGLKANELPIIFEAKGQRYEGLDDDVVKIIYTLNGQIHSMTCDYVVGCDGYRGISRRTIPKSQRQEVSEELPYAWLEWQSSNSSEVKSLIISFGENGFAMQVPDTNDKTRFYLQVKRGTEKDDLPIEELIWEDFENRIGSSIERTKMENKKLDYMRLYHSQAMQYGRLFIAGDAAHMVPRLGSKGLNLAFKDAAKLADGFFHFYKNVDESYLENYTQRCLKDNLKTIEFTNHLNYLFHKNEKTSFEIQVDKIQQLLTNENQKLELIQYLVG